MPHTEDQADTPFDAVPFVRMTGNEHLHVAGQPLETTVVEFWQWAASGLMGNTLRGWFAEFLVASALGLAAGGVRREWEGHDLTTADGIRIEVKASAYVQWWRQRKLSTPRFSIQPSRSWTAATDEYTVEAGRHCDVYVFCLHGHRVKRTANPLDVAQWEFYVLPASVVDERFRASQAVSLVTLASSGAVPVTFGDIASSVRRAADQAKVERSR